MTLALAEHELLLVRHGETAWSLSGQHTGRTDIPLTANGRAVAAALAPVLAPLHLAAVLCSPLSRARTTCDLAGLGHEARIDGDLSEWDYGDYEGLTTDAIHSRAPGWLLFRDGCPGGESPEAIGARVDRLLGRLRGGTATGPVALFAHGHVLRVLAARWLGLPVRQGAGFLLDTATLSVLSHYRGDPAIRCWNAPIGL
ncbi:histidine phosphatase family protein [Synechococcus sp. RSCCF101]|uniref:histidine phosphatase family protein n=1 Tax=Synechococcus sp. RSCCF101 TaxID=2511069 RepID=UPI0012456493|nr:histidine phosphatase family protein [Synechococcus sp. RSCCF101]QEY31069.1 histidine phosphatase family protein [Synechococcus sp. RSCCF101]